MYSKELQKILLKNGWCIVSQKGSHCKMKKGNESITLPMHNKDLKPRIKRIHNEENGLEISPSPFF